MATSLARFASTDSALHGKIHQVIGAVVDGTQTLLAPTPRSLEDLDGPQDHQRMGASHQYNAY